MNHQIEAILDRLEAAHAEMIEHLSGMRALLKQDDREWSVEMQKYHAVRNALFEADKQLADNLRSREQEARETAFASAHC